MFNILMVEFGNKGSLDGGTTCGKLRRVESCGRGRRGVDRCRFREDLSEARCDFRGMRGTT